MACHQHRCCRRPATFPASADGHPFDYVLLAANDASTVEGAATRLSSVGASTERHDLGLRINCRGVDWRATLGRLSDALSPSARRTLRVALIPLGADTHVFHRALLSSQTLDAFLNTMPAAATPCAATPCAPGHSAFLGDPFKGETLE